MERHTLHFWFRTSESRFCLEHTVMDMFNDFEYFT